MEYLSKAIVIIFMWILVILMIVVVGYVASLRENLHWFWGIVYGLAMLRAIEGVWGKTKEFLSSDNQDV